MFPTIHLGPLVLPAPTLSILAGIYFALTVLERTDRSGKLVNIVLAGLGFGLVCARLGYALRYPAAFLSSPLGLISTNPGMFDPTVGTAGGLALAYGLLRRAKLAVSPALDALTPALAVFAAALALAHLASGDAYGAPANLPWAVDLWGARRHPSQAYELAAALLILAAAWPWPQRQPAAAGLRFWAFIALTALARLFLEGFRGDSILLWGGLRAAQVIAWLILALSLWQLKPPAVSGAAPAGTSAPETPSPAPETPPEG
jgi:prolipoprotein diacylglyceryltransferase